MSETGYKKVTQKRTTMGAIRDQAFRGQPPESELKLYEFGNGRNGKRSKYPQYSGTFNEATGLWE